MSIPTRVSLALVVLLISVGVLSGCGMSAEERAAVQTEQLKEYVAQADGWGAEIIAQIPESEIETVADSLGGTRKANDYYEEWPKYYYWAHIIELRAEGARTPTEVADDLEPWLKEHGWERNTESEFPPRRDSFARSYFQDGYHLTVEVYTQAPPRAQSLHFSIVTPQTDPDRR